MTYNVSSGTLNPTAPMPAVMQAFLFVLAELRVRSRGDEVCLNPGGTEDEDLEVERCSEEEGESCYS